MYVIMFSVKSLGLSMSSSEKVRIMAGFEIEASSFGVTLLLDAGRGGLLLLGAGRMYVIMFSVKSLGPSMSPSEKVRTMAGLVMEVSVSPSASRSM